jgi:hypothetical protein
MKDTIRNIRFPTVLFIFTLFYLSACTSITSRITEKSKGKISSSEAKEIISNLKRRNLDLKTSKGTGTLTFRETEHKNLSARMAWVATPPDKIRIALTGVSGQPMVSVASDGHWLYFVSHTEGKFYKRRATKANMKKIFSFPVKPEDVVNLLNGRVPMETYDSAFVMNKVPLNRPSNPGTTRSENIEREENGDIVVLKDGWGNVREKIFIDSNGKDVHKVEVFDFVGTLAYRVEFKRMQHIKEYRIPSLLVFSDDKGSGLELDIDRYWADAAVSPSVFTLAPPERIPDKKNAVPYHQN